MRIKNLGIYKKLCEKEKRKSDRMEVDSWNLFRRLRINTDFLELDPVEWPQNEEYLSAKAKIDDDTAERGVKLMEDYNSSITKNERQKQYLLQVSKYYLLEEMGQYSISTCKKNHFTHGSTART